MPELSREPERLGNPRCLLLAAEVPSEHGPVSKLVRTSALSLTTKRSSKSVLRSYCLVPELRL